MAAGLTPEAQQVLDELREQVAQATERALLALWNLGVDEDAEPVIIEPETDR